MSRRYERPPVPTVPAELVADKSAIVQSIVDEANTISGPEPEPDTMPTVISYTSVQFLSGREIPRLDAAKGVTASSTIFFDTSRMRGLTIELDTGSGVVSLRQNGGVRHVPRENVLHFGPTAEEMAVQARAASVRAKATADANAAAALETERIASLPAT